MHSVSLNTLVMVIQVDSSMSSSPRISPNQCCSEVESFAFFCRWLPHDCLRDRERGSSTSRQFMAMELMSQSMLPHSSPFSRQSCLTCCMREREASVVSTDVIIMRQPFACMQFHRCHNWGCRWLANTVLFMATFLAILSIYCTRGMNPLVTSLCVVTGVSVPYCTVPQSVAGWWR